MRNAEPCACELLHIHTATACSCQRVLTILVFRRIIVGGMASPLAVNLRIMQNKHLWRAFGVAFCALVFFFALHAKTAVYNNGAPAKLTPSTSCKLWTSSQKMETPSLGVSGGVLFWMAALLLLTLYLRRHVCVCSAFLVPPPGILPLRHLSRFLRPPPVLA